MVFIGERLQRGPRRATSVAPGSPQSRRSPWATTMEYFDPNPRPPAGECGRYSAYVPCVATSEFYHYFQTDHETPETVPWTGLESAARAYARIIDGVNRMELSDLQRPEESATP